MDKKFFNMFFEQSYKDNLLYYKETINGSKYSSWDFVVLTASNEEQAKNYTNHINERLEKGLIDNTPKYLVIPDCGGERIGSGGATINVLNVLKTDHGVDFNHSKILLIHSGGDSKRIPQYSACGKLFSAVPKPIASNFGATIFDELLACTSLMPSKMKSGLFVLSGDAILIFNQLQVRLDPTIGLSAISIKKEISIGKNHGVFLVDADNRVIKFLHKKSENDLISSGAADPEKNVNVDTGAIYFNADVCLKLLELVLTNDDTDPEKFKKFVGKKSGLSLYGDMIYPFADAANFNEYLKEPIEGMDASCVEECRKTIWTALNDTKMHIVSVAPAEFLHFGTTKEIMQLLSKNLEDFKYLNWSNNVASNVDATPYATYQSYIINCEIANDSYIEKSIVENCSVGHNSILSQVTASDIHFPPDIAASGLKLKNGKFVARLYGINDNPKDGVSTPTLLNNRLPDIIEKYKLRANPNETLWEFKLYPMADTLAEAVSKALKIYNLQDVDDLNNEDLVSLKSSFYDADVDWLVEWNDLISKKVTVSNVKFALSKKTPYETFANKFSKSDLDLFMKTAELKHDISAWNRAMLFYNKMHGVQPDKKALFDNVARQCELTFRKTRNPLKAGIFKVNLPARVNFAGGWTDTPPYCIENGGTVLNASILLNNELPIRVTVERLEEHKFELLGIDTKVKTTTSSRDEILSCNDPFDGAALLKAVVVACGIVKSEDDEDLSNVYSVLGGGLRLSTEVINIPKGSGLGTSSILCCACVKALNQIMGIKDDINEINDLVMLSEQLMSTGGGWQDQIGGAVSGFKIIKSKKGKQSLEIEKINLSDETKSLLEKRFALIFTGQQRLARNLLRDVIYNYLTGEEKTVSSLKKMEVTACAMQRALEKGDIDDLAKLMNAHWDLSKNLDGGTTNTCIDYILNSCADLIDGKMICGAGGGGFLQVLLKTETSKKELQNRLHRVFGKTGISVWQSTFVF